MRNAWNIAKKDLALRMRDRSVFIIGLVAPLALAFIFNLVFGGVFNDVGEEITLSLGVANADAGPIGATFDDVLASLVDDGFIELEEFADDSAARQAADEGDVGAVFIVPAGMTESMLSGTSGTIEVVGNVDAPTTTDIAEAIARQFSAGVTRANLSAATALGTGVIGIDQIQQAAADAGMMAPLVAIGPIESEIRQLDSATYFVAALSVFFMFFIAGLSVTDMLEERREGTLARLLVAPIPRSSILFGKSLTSVIIGIVSMTVLVVASTFLMGASWGPVLGVAMMVATATLAIVAVMSMVGGLARTPEQAGNLQSIVAVTFAMLGGTFVPIAEGEGLLSTLQYITPNAWFLRGLAEMATGDVVAGLASAGVLLGMAVLAGLVSIPLVKKLVHL
jgi:ABC-2 type transport system permease protein